MPETLNLHLNRDGIIEPATQMALIINSVAALTLAALETADMNNLPSLGSFHVRPAPETEEKRREQCTHWVLNKGIEDIAAAVRSSLEEALLFISVGKLSGNVQTFGEFEGAVLDIRHRAQALNFPGLLKEVEAGLSADLTMKDEMKSLQRVRNCLVHRRGIVGVTDCDEGTTELVVKLPYLRFAADIDGQLEDLTFGTPLIKDTMIVVKLEVRERRFALGSQVQFSKQEFNEITSACWHFANEIAAKLPHYPTPAT